MTTLIKVEDDVKGSNKEFIYWCVSESLSKITQSLFEPVFD